MARATVVFTYRSSDGTLQSGTFFIGDQSSLYNLEVNDTFPVRFDPAHPDRYYSDEYVVPVWWKFNAILVFFFALTFLFVILKSR